MLFNTVFTTETTNSQCLVSTLRATKTTNITKIPYYHPPEMSLLPRLQPAQLTKLQQIFVAGTLVSFHSEFEAEIPFQSAKNTNSPHPVWGSWIRTSGWTKSCENAPKQAHIALLPHIPTYKPLFWSLKSMNLRLSQKLQKFKCKTQSFSHWQPCLLLVRCHSVKVIVMQ